LNRSEIVKINDSRREEPKEVGGLETSKDRCSKETWEETCKETRKETPEEVVDSTTWTKCSQLSMEISQS